MTISPFTEPGTKVRCVNASPGAYGPTGLIEGAVYTVKQIELANNIFVAALEEVEPPVTYQVPWGLVFMGWGLPRFDYLADDNDDFEELGVEEEELEFV